LDWVPNLRLGVTAENQEQANKRIPILLQIPAKVRFISVEPMLGPVDITKWFSKGINWVICGGETGSGARPMNPDWAESLRDQCIDAGVPFFFKKSGNSGEHLLDGRVWEQIPG
jgi:protein gp37